jgi:arylsulfatase A-like enzyme
MKKYSFIILLSAGLFLFSCTHKNVIHEREGKPNIILIITDDQGIGDIGYMGNSYIKTPVLDSLANNAIILSNFYVSPVYAPTRASLLTGKYSVQTGVHDTYNGGAIMALNEYTLAEILSNNGYITGMFGKWHLGDNYPFRPSDQGFEESLYHPSGGIGQVGDINNYYRFDSSYFDPILYYNNELVHTKGYCTDVFTIYAIDFINKNKDKSFFLYLSFNAPHTPLQVPQEYLDMYNGIDNIIRSESDTRFFAATLNDQELESVKRVYSMVSNIDDDIG